MASGGAYFFNGHKGWAQEKVQVESWKNSLAKTELCRMEKGPSMFLDL